MTCKSSKYNADGQGLDFKKKKVYVDRLHKKNLNFERKWEETQ